MKRLATPTVATVLGVLALLTAPAAVVLAVLIHQLSSSSDIAEAVGGVSFTVAFSAVGTVVARRQPRNPIGWLLLAVVLSVGAADDGASYAYLADTLHRGRLPLGQLAVLLSSSWAYGLLLAPLIILLFPDGGLGRRWRWPLRACIGLATLFLAGTLSIAISDLGLRRPVDASGNLAGFNSPSGANAWFAPVETLGYAAFSVLMIASVVYQVRSYRRAGSDRREQLKWLASGGAALAGCIVLNIVNGGGSNVIGDLTFSFGLAALPAAIGVAILRYRLYEIDRLISRTLAYALLTALLVGTFVGLVALTTDVLAFSSSVGVAASTLVAAALLHPLRGRLQRVVDRRFNRARYDADATVAAFAAQLRDAVDIDAVEAQPLATVQQAIQPAHATVWIRERAR